MTAIRLRLLSKLATISDAAPGINLGAIIEDIENRAWDTVPQRHVSMRLMNLPDEILERGMDSWLKDKGLA